MKLIFKNMQKQLIDNRTQYHELLLHQDVDGILENKHYINTFIKLIKATIGLDQTNENIVRLFPFPPLEKPIPMSFEIYVPSHKLEAEEVDKINNFEVSNKESIQT